MERNEYFEEVDNQETDKGNGYHRRALDYLFMVIKDFEEKNHMKYPIANCKHFKRDGKK